jgi:hypothetical protein
VVNQGAADELISGPKAWNASALKVALAPDDKDPVVLPGVDPKEDPVTADRPEVGVVVSSEEWNRRFREAPADQPVEPHLITWEARTPPARTRDQQGRESDGIFETVLETGTKAGETRDVVARFGDVVAGTTDLVVVEPGKAAVARLSPRDKQIPADGATTVLLTVEAIDAHGNPVADGTPVVWEEPGDGELLEALEKTTEGKATAKFRAGLRFPQTQIRVFVDEAIDEITMTQAPLTVQLTAPSSAPYRGEVEVEARISSAAGEPHDSAELEWFTHIGRVDVKEPLKAGVAKGVWRADPSTPYRPFTLIGAHIGAWGNAVPVAVDSSAVAALDTAQVLQATGDTSRVTQAAAAVDPAGPVPIATVTPAVIAGDRSTDGVFPLERPDGSFEDVPYKAKAEYRLLNLQPGERGLLRLGSNRNPNVAPAAYYRADEGIVEGLVLDETGRHDAPATGVLSVTEGFSGPGLGFDGQGVVRIPDAEDLAFSGGFMVQTAVRPPPGLAQTLIERAGDFRLSLVLIDDQLKAQFTLTTPSGEQSVTSFLPVPANIWSLVTGRYEAGRLWVGINSSDAFVALSQSPVHSTAEITIGPSFSGTLDEIRIADLTRAPLATFSNGQQVVEFQADATGAFTTEIQSSGQLGSDMHSAGALRGMPLAALAPNADTPPAATERTIGVLFADTQAYLEDSALQIENPVGFAVVATIAYAYKFTKGIWVGFTGADDDDVIVLAGDLVASLAPTPLRGYAAARDFINAGDRAVRLDGSADGFDALTLSLGVVEAGKKLAPGKVRALTNLGDIVKLIKKGGSSSGAMARLVSRQVKQAFSVLGDSGALRKLGEIASTGSTAAKEALSYLLAGVGRTRKSVDALETVARNADDATEVLIAANRAQNRAGTRFPFLLKAVGACFGVVGAAAGDIPMAAATTCPAVVAKAFDGAVEAYEAVKAVIKKGKPEEIAGAKVLNIANRDPAGSLGLFQRIKDLSTAGAANLGQLVRNLGSASDGAFRGALHVLHTYEILLKGKVATVVFERVAEITPKVGKGVKRFYDLFDGKIFYECKNWLWNNFPPIPLYQAPASSYWQVFRQWSQLRWAEIQWIRDIIHLRGDAVENLRWVFPKAMEAHAVQIRVYFARLLDGPYLQERILGLAPTRAELQDYAEMIKQIKQRINTIIIFE